MSTEAPSPPEPDVLDLGSAPSDRRRRRVLAVVVIMVLVAVGGVAGWQWWPRAPDPMTREELQGVYAGMVRSDGTNDAVNLDPTASPAADFAVEPADCKALLWAFGRSFPNGSRDGVTTYWDSDATSLATIRFDDQQSADDVLAGLRTAMGACADRPVDITADSLQISGTLTNLPEGQLGRDSDGFGFLVTTTGDDENAPTRFIVRLMSYANTLTVVMRYDFAPAFTGSVREDRLLASLLAQMKAVLALRDR